MDKKLGIIALVIAVIALGLSVFAVVHKSAPAEDMNNENGDIQYVMFLGTNDKDSNQPYGTPEEAKAKVDEVLTNYFEGFTIQEANGGWVNDDGSVAHEYTVMILLSDTTEEKVHAAADELIQEFNQSSVMIQANKTKTEFYSGE